MKVVALSDTHNLHEYITIPECDLLIHCGDATNRGSVADLTRFQHWFSCQPAKHKIYVPGNHDLDTQVQPQFWRDTFAQDNMYCLIDQACVIEEHHFYGSPWSVTFGRWAWMDSEEGLERRYQGIPDETNYIINHGPVYGHCDKTDDNTHAGSSALLNRCMELANLKQVFSGHIHEAAGESFLQMPHHRIQFSNCAMVNLKVQLKNPPRQYEIP